MRFVPPASLDSFASAYPCAPALLRHDLMGHRLLTIEALARAALDLPPAFVERRVGNAPNGGDFAMDRSDDADVASVIRSIGTSGNWIMLRFIEQLPAYRDLLETLMDDIGGAILPATGAGTTLRGFVFISAPGTHTPFHFDCEYNILFQIAGDKQFATYPSAAPWLPADIHEAYYRGGDNLLPWEDRYAGDAMVHALSPGDALYVPYAAPHWVRAGTTPSISLSMTWQSTWSEALGDAMQVNPLLRRWGLPTGAMPAWPRAAPLRTLGCRLARKAGLL